MMKVTYIGHHEITYIRIPVNYELSKSNNEEVIVRYLRDKGVFLEHAFMALQKYFENKASFEAFFETIPTDEEKDLFLKTSSFYRFLVIEGRFKFEQSELNEGLKYIDDSYKYMAIFSLIESLYVGEKYADLYCYMVTKRNKVQFPIGKKSDLKTVYEKYKEEYGAVRNALKFFDKLDDRDKDKIFKKFRIANESNSIIDLAKHLYQIRSDFVHKAKFVLGFGANPSIGRIGKKILVNNLQIRDLMIFFEHGLLRHFGFTNPFYVQRW